MPLASAMGSKSNTMIKDVWVLLIEWSAGDVDVLEVFTSEKKARAAWDKLPEDEQNLAYIEQAPLR